MTSADSTEVHLPRCEIDSTLTLCQVMAICCKNHPEGFQSSQRRVRPEGAPSKLVTSAPGVGRTPDCSSCSIQVHPHTSSHRRHPPASLLHESRGSAEHSVCPALPYWLPVKSCQFSGQGCWDGIAQLCTLSSALVFQCP